MCITARIARRFSHAVSADHQGRVGGRSGGLPALRIQPHLSRGRIHALPPDQRDPWGADAVAGHPGELVGHDRCLGRSAETSGGGPWRPSFLSLQLRALPGLLVGFRGGTAIGGAFRVGRRDELGPSLAGAHRARIHGDVLHADLCVAPGRDGPCRGVGFEPVPGASNHRGWRTRRESGLGPFAHRSRLARGPSLRPSWHDRDGPGDLRVGRLARKSGADRFPILCGSREPRDLGAGVGGDSRRIGAHHLEAGRLSAHPLPDR